MDNNIPTVDIGWRKYFLPAENKSIVPTLLFGFLVFLFYSIYQSVHFNPFSPSIGGGAIFYYFLLQSWIPVIVFSLALHSPNNKIGKRIGILFIFAIVFIVILGSTVFSGEAGLALVELVPVLVLYGVVAYFLGFIARSIMNFTPLVFRVFLVIIILFIFPALTLYDVVIYSNSSNLTESRCNALGKNSAQIECFDKLAHATNNPIACEGSYGDSSTMDKCYNDITNKLVEENKLDPAICLKIPTHSGVIGEGIGCVQQIAEKLDDITKCEILPGGEFSLRERCVKVVATKFKNFNYETRLKSCLVLGDKNDQVTCFSIVRDSFYDTEYYDRHTATFNQCKLLSGIDKDVCNFANRVEYIGSQRQCELILDPSIKKSCESGSRKL